MSALPPLIWATCDSCGARANERGNGRANRCESCLLKLEMFAERALGLLELERRAESNDCDTIAELEATAAELGLAPACTCDAPDDQDDKCKAHGQEGFR